jgi:hypothetical protein
VRLIAIYAVLTAGLAGGAVFGGPQMRSWCRIMLCFAALAWVALLFGCISAEERAERDAAICAGYGFMPGTDAFAGCRLSLVQHRQLLLTIAASPR